jgi:hypothetical protein
MSSVATLRRVDLGALPWPASQRPDGAGGFVVVCHDDAVTDAEAGAAVEAAPDHVDSIPADELADRIRVVRDDVNTSDSVKRLCDALLGDGTTPQVDARPSR